MRAGDIVLTPGTSGPYHGVPALVLPKHGAAKDRLYACVWTGKYELLYESEQLRPHGKVRRIKTYKTTKHEFAQFRVSFGESVFTVDVPVTNDLYKIEDLRKAAFLKASERKGT